MSWRLAASAAAVVCLLAGWGDRANVAAQSAQRSGELAWISPQAMAQLQTLLSEKASRTAAERKIDSQLLLARRRARREAMMTGLGTLAINVPTAADGRADVELRGSVSAGLLQRLRAGGARVLAQDAGAGVVRLQATLDQVHEMAAWSDVRSIHPTPQAVTNGITSGEPGVRPRTRSIDRAALGAAIRRALGQDAITNVGSQLSEGDLTHKASTTRSTYGFDGTGVKIGVLSDGVTNLATSQASGDLGAVTVVSGQTGDGDEGTAMLEIIHDLAPGAQLYFATAFNGITSFANNIRTLRNTYGCDVIVDDVYYFVESPFQDGQASSVVSQYNSGAVTQAVKDVTDAGALYFSSAGNAGNLNDGTSGTWEGDFSNGGNITIANYGTRPVHSFGSQTYNTLTSIGSVGVINLYWADPLGGSSNDYDLFLFNSTGTSILAFSTGDQSGSHDPYEQLTVPSTGTNGRIMIVQWSGSARFLHLGTNRGRLSSATSGEIHGHAATSATNSFGVAATPARSPGPSPNPFSSSNSVETFSSDGPRRIFFNADGSAITAGNFLAAGGQLLTKPDLTAADRVLVSGAGGFPTSGCTTCVFSGTSAAAPHAAAIAALIKSADSSLTASQIRTAILGSAIDIEASGTDRDAGVGIVMADTAVQSVLGAYMSVDAPGTSSTLTQPFTMSGWAIDRRGTSGTGVDTVHVWAFPSSGTAVFAGVASYGAARADVGSAYGSRFTSSGFSLTITGLSPGAYTLVAYAESTASNSFNQSRSVSVTIPSSLPAMSIDTPGNNSTIGPTFTAAGWAIDRASSSGTGVDGVHVYAYPRTSGGLGAGVFLGAATLGGSRTDVGAVYGSQFNNAGYSLQASGLSLGNYRLVIYAHSSLTGTFNQSQFTDVTVAADPLMSIDTPSSGTKAQPFLMAGWAIDRAATIGSGVDVVNVWAFPVGGGSAVALGPVTLGGSRADVGAVFGSQFTNSAYSLSVSGLTSGQQYTIVVYARSTVTGTFNQQRSVTVTIQ